MGAACQQRPFLIPPSNWFRRYCQIESGDKVPAPTCALLQVKNLRVDESNAHRRIFTRRKKHAVVDARAALGDRFCLAYSVRWLPSARTGRGGVHRRQTEIGRISSMLRTVPQLVTPLLRQCPLQPMADLCILGIACATLLMAAIFITLL